MVKITCPKCSVTDGVPDSFLGKEIVCCKCEAVFTVDSPKTVPRKSAPTQVAKPDPAENPSRGGDADRVLDAEEIPDAEDVSDGENVSEAEDVSDRDRVSDHSTGKRSGKRQRLSGSKRRQLSPWLVVGSSVVCVLIGVGLVIALRGGSGTVQEATAERKEQAKFVPPSLPVARAKDQTKRPEKVIAKGAAPVTQPVDKGTPAVTQPDDKPGLTEPPGDKGTVPQDTAPVTKDDDLALPPPPVALSDQAIYLKALKSTVYIVVKGKGRDGKLFKGWGSGSLVNRLRKVALTNVHVIDGAFEIRVFFPEYKDGQLVTENRHYAQQFDNGGGLRGSVIATDPGRDVALVELDGALPANAQAIPLAMTKRLVPGQRNLSIGGNPRGSQGQWVSTTGTIRQVYQRQWKPGAYNLNALVVEVQSPTNAGDSGGPVVNERAEQIAVTQGGIDSVDTHLISWAIHIKETRKLLESKGIEWVRPRPAGGAVLELAKLRRALESKNVETCRRAAAYLAEFGPEAEPLTDDLIKVLSHKDALVRQNAARALGEIGEHASRAVPALMELLHDVDEVQGAALAALAEMGPAVVPAVPTVAKLLDSGKKDVREGAARVLIGLGPEAKQELSKLGAKAAKAVSPLAQLLKENKDKEGLVRRAAAVALEAIGGADPQTAVPALTYALRDPVLAVRTQAATALGAIGPKAEPAASELGRVLLENLDSDLPTRQACAAALKGIGPGSVKAVGALTAAAYNSDVDTRLNTLLALSQIGPKAEEAVPALLSCLRDRSRFPDYKTYTKLFAAAVVALAKTGEPARKQILSLNIIKQSTDWWEVTGAVLAIKESVLAMKDPKLSKIAANHWAKHIETHVIDRMGKGAMHQMGRAYVIAVLGDAAARGLERARDPKASKEDKEAARVIERARAVLEQSAYEFRELRRLVIEAVDKLKNR
jgi:HEAT repeat protein/S1-C subfamily serine protease